jgi:hypothetical protein
VVEADRRGWFKAIRSQDALELIRANHRAFVLLYIIAARAKWRPGFTAAGLEIGEAFLGDFENYGMTQQQYRTAKVQLEEWGFATFNATKRGTIGKLIGTRVFEVLPLAANEQVNALRNERGNDYQERRAESRERKDKRTGDLRRPLPFAQKPNSVSEAVAFMRTTEYADEAWLHRWLHYNNLHGWTIDGKPIRNWRATYVPWCESLQDYGGEPAEVPNGWEPHIADRAEAEDQCEEF